MSFRKQSYPGNTKKLFESMILNPDGIFEGAAVGVFDGDRVGLVDGFAVVGYLLGMKDGDAEGVLVGW